MPELNEASLALWSSFVVEVHAIIRAGLADMAADCAKCGFAVMNELELNRQLLFRMHRAAGRRKQGLLAQNPLPALSPNHTWELSPILDANNQPSPDDSRRAARENKRPDFQWGFLDHLVDGDNASRTYVVECKRLGIPVRADWVFNTNYVSSGLNRFLLEEYLYGKDDVEGGMIGYVQSMDVATIRQEINAQLAIDGLPELPFPQPDPDFEALRVAEHVLTRENARSPFRLRHFWIDFCTSVSEGEHANLSVPQVPEAA